MAVTKDKSAPYAPSSAILGIIDRYRNRGLPTPIVSDVLNRSGISDSLIPRTLQALQVLDLIDEHGEPTPTLEGLRSAPTAEYKKSLDNWLKSTYADVFSYVDPSEDGEDAIRDAFRNYKPYGQMSRMVALFLGLCVEAGIAEKVPRKQKPRTPTRKQESQSVKAHHSLGEQVPSALAGLLDSLPSADEGWTKTRRDEFVKMFGTVLNFCIPVQQDKPLEQNDEPDAEQPQ